MAYTFGGWFNYFIIITIISINKILIFTIHGSAQSLLPANSKLRKPGRKKKSKTKSYKNQGIGKLTLH